MTVLLGLIVIAVIAVLVIAAARPKTFRVARTEAIAAPAPRILPLIEDFRRWPDWSPYEKIDPSMQRTLSGPPSGQGAVYAWSGSGKAGAGRMEIAAVTPSEVTIRLDFSKPFRAENIARFTLAGRGEATDVTWSMEGASPFLFRVMGLFMNMDRMIGKDFEAGLASLKSLAEKPA